MDKLNLVRANPQAYKAKTAPQIASPEPGHYLAVDGQGGPNEDGGAFQAAVGALYGMGWTLKFLHKAREQDFQVPPLESFWSVEGRAEAWRTAPRSAWRWTAVIRMPDFVEPADLEHAREQLAKKGKEGPFELVELRAIDEGPCVQILHLGPYAEEPATIERMHDFAAEQGFQLRGRHHEVYLSDPNRTKPERLKTILRHAVEPAVS